MSLPKIGYLHFPKCAGTSIFVEFKKLYKPEDFSDVRHDAPLAKGFSIYSGHFAASRLTELSLDHTFTVVRDPFDRLVSAYRFLRSHSQDFALEQGLDLALKARSLSIEAFCNLPDVSRSPYFNNPYVQMLCRESLLPRWERKAPLDYPEADPKKVNVDAALSAIERLNLQVFEFDQLGKLQDALGAWTHSTPSLGLLNVTGQRHCYDGRFEETIPFAAFSEARDRLLNTPHIRMLLEKDFELIGALPTNPN